ncbi:MAG: DNA repair protein RadA, partial [Xanthomonadales bacterium]|nr:DNA repair protein RadA [Xanthomonadales bacterium]
MTAKTKSHFLCEQCGAELSKWAGQCPECRLWNCVVEFKASAGRRSGHSGNRSGFAGVTDARITSLSTPAGETERRIPSGTSELDRV